MKILHIIPSLYRGGAERLALDICIEIQRRQGYDVRLVTFREDNTYKFLSDKIQWDVIPSEINLSFLNVNTDGAKQLEVYVKGFKPDIIHSHMYEAEIISRSIIYPGAKWFSHCHNNMPQFEPLRLDTFFGKKKILNYYERSYLLKRYKKNGGNHFITISKNVQEYFQHVLPKDLRFVSLLSNATNTKKFSPPITYLKKPLHQLGLITIGRLDDNKNQIFLLHVLNLLQQKGYNVTLYILGDGHKKKSLEDKAVEYGIAEKVIFTGIVPNVEEYLWSNHIYVHSSLSEGFGLVFIEAMAAGLPVISLDGKGNRDLIKNNWNGFFIQEQDVELFAQKIIAIMSDENKYTQMSENAIEFSKKFDIITYVDQLLLLYKSALQVY